MKIVKAYQCEYCSRARAYITASAVAAHEVRCFHNPVTRSCATCRYLLHRYVPTGRFGYVTHAWSCTANAPLAPLTTNCPAWNLQVFHEF